MKIQHINLSRGWRGGERQTLLLMQGLRDLGNESTLLARAGEPMAERAAAAGFTVETIRKPFLLGGVRIGDADIAHCHETRALQLAALWKGRFRLPIVTTRRVDFSPGASAFTRWKYRRADKTVAISNRVHDVMLDWGLPEDRLTVIHSAIDTERRDNPDSVAALRRRFAGKRLVGTVSALVGHKDLPTLLRAAGRIQRIRPDVHFVVLGEGEMRPALERQIAESRLTNVTLEGFQADSYSYYPVFDVFAITSNEEGLGSAVLDAFLYGVPVVATAGGGLPEMVVSEQTGVLCPIGDDEAIANGVLRLLEDKVLAERVTSGARNHLDSEFTVGRMAARYQKVYSALLGR